MFVVVVGGIFGGILDFVARRCWQNSSHNFLGSWIKPDTAFVAA